MSNLAYNTRIMTELEIKAAEKDLISKLDEAAEYADSECADYAVFSKQLREKITNGI